MPEEVEETPTTTGATPSPAPTPATVPVWSLLLPILAVVMLLLVAAQQPNGKLHIWVMDVGQGDAIFLKMPHGHTALIDGGPGATPLLNGLASHIPFWQHDIDLVVLTHPHEDHMMGLIDLVGRYNVGQIVQTEFTATTAVRGEWLARINEHSVPVHFARRGEIITFEGEPDVAMKVLSPATADAAREGKGGDINNTSVVLKLTYGTQGMLLEGDAQAAAEGEMEKYEASDLASNILKVGHHGSDTSSTIPFLRDVRPQVAVISVGAGNKFGHPASQTIDALESVGAHVYRTDISGAVEIIADKERSWVRVEK